MAPQGILTAIKVVKELAEAAKNNHEGLSEDGYKKTLLKDNLAITNGAITKLLGKYIIEPIVICSKGAKETEVFDQVVTLNTDLFCSFYMQAFEILGRDYGLDQTTIIDIMSTDRHTVGAVGERVLANLGQLTADLVTNEDFRKAAAKTLSTAEATFSSVLFEKYGRIKISVEADAKVDVTVDKKVLEEQEALQKAKDNAAAGKFISSDKSKAIDRNLEKSVGYAILQRELMVNFSYFDKQKKPVTIQIPLIVKAHVIVTDILNIINMIAPKTSDNSFFWRFNDWRAGAITFRELVFAGDLVSKYKQNKLKDKDGLMKTLEERQESASIAAAFNKKIIGFEKFFNMLVLTSDDKIILDKQLKGDIMSEAKKQELLTMATSMTMTIIDPDYERVSLLTRDIRGRSETSFKALRKRNDNDSSHFTEMLKAVMLNKPIAF